MMGERCLTKTCVLPLKGNKAGQGFGSDELGQVVAWVRVGGQGRLLCSGDMLHLSDIREPACGYLGFGGRVFLGKGTTVQRSVGGSVLEVPRRQVWLVTSEDGKVARPNSEL